jgi:hypothetical protein
MLAASRISLGSLLFVSHSVFIKHTLDDSKFLWINMVVNYICTKIYVATGNWYKEIKCTHMKCHTNVNSTPPTQLPDKFSFIVATFIHNHFESPNTSKICD